MSSRAHEDSQIRQLVPVQADLQLEDPESIVQALLKLETAHWHYVDYVQPRHQHLPHLRFKHFITIYIPWLRGKQLFDAMKLFNRYKKTLPIYGSIILNPDRTLVLLVKNVNSDSWSFPKGKQELGESEIQSVVRETMEETNFSVIDLLDDRKRLRHRKATFFIIENVPEYLFFVPWKRTEISSVAWHSVAELSTHPRYNIYIRHLYEKLHAWIEARRLSPKVIPVLDEDEAEQSPSDEEQEEDD
jgi:mRNA-decapping enzyme subunit 2